jgi:hypothetical protein
MPSRGWVDIIKIDLGETGWSCMKWIDLAQDIDQWRNLANTELKLRVPYNAEKFFSSFKTGGFPRRAELRVRVISWLVSLGKQYEAFLHFRTRFLTNISQMCAELKGMVI